MPRVLPQAGGLSARRLAMVGGVLLSVFAIAERADAQTMSPSSATIGVAQSVTLTAYTKTGATMTNAKWSSSSNSIASVSGGVVTAKAPGQVTVTASKRGQKATATIVVSSTPDPDPDPDPDPIPSPSPGYIWISPQELAARPTSGTAWTNLLSAANQSCGIPNIDNQDDPVNVCIMAKALVFARTGNVAMRIDVASAVNSVIVLNKPYSGRALALGRELISYVIAANLINLSTYDPSLDAEFRQTIRTLLTTFTSDGPDDLIECHELRPNNWGTHCGASRAAVAAYLGDTAQLNRIAQVFKGWLGDRAAYAGFSYGELSWQCDPAKPVGINPMGCSKDGHSLDGVLPDDQRRGGSYSWPPTGENYVYEALQGALAQAVILHRAGYDVFNWSNRALLRAFQWQHSQAGYPAEGDDTWQPHLINFFYGTSFPAPIPARPGKNVGWTDWTHKR